MSVESRRGALGDGRIYRAPGRKVWMMQFYAPSPCGKMVRVKESSGTSDAVAANHKLRDRLAAVRVARKTGGAVELPVNRRVTVAEVLDDYLADLRLREKKGVRNEEFRLGKESPLRQALGHVLVTALSRRLLVGYVETRRSRDKSANATINHDLTSLRSALRLAERAGRIFRVPPFPETLRGRVRQGFFTAEEVARLVEAAPVWLAEMIRFAYATGWRRGELLALRWEWVDGEAGEIRLPDSKNDEGRVVPIAGELVSIMDRLKGARCVTRPDGSIALAETVFHCCGSPISRKRFVRAWNSARKAAKLEGRLFHDFRRCAARRLIGAGVSQAVAMRVTGHKTPSMFRRYQIVESSDVAHALAQVASRAEKRSGGTLVMIDRGNID